MSEHRVWVSETETKTTNVIDLRNQPPDEKLKPCPGCGFLGFVTEYKGTWISTDHIIGYEKDFDTYQVLQSCEAFEVSHFETMARLSGAIADQ